MLLTRERDLIRIGRHSAALRSALVFLTAVVAASCQGTSSVVSPDPVACKFDVAPAGQIIGGSSASGTVTVATTSMCAWTATTDVGWITVTPPTSASGNGRVNFAVAFNPGPERTGSVIIGGQPSTITQAGTAMPCTYTIDPGSQTIGADGGTGAPVQVRTSFGCRWTATSNAPWIAVTAGASGTGYGVVTFAVEANTGGARTGTLTIAGRTATISQTAAGTPPPPPSPTACWYTISPASNGVAAIGGGGHMVAVTTASTCAWTATSNDAWITIATGASGTGSGVVTYTAAGNTGAARRGTLTIAGLTATVTQGIMGPLPR